MHPAFELMESNLKPADNNSQKNAFPSLLETKSTHMWLGDATKIE